VDAHGTVTLMRYDENGQLVERTHGTALERTTRWEHRPLGGTEGGQHGTMTSRVW
jgi:YD repeat-containing protein